MSRNPRSIDIKPKKAYTYDSVCGIVYDNTPYYFHKNLQGDVIAIADQNGDIVARYSYDAWGYPTVVEDTSANSIAIKNPFLYRGYYFDSDTELYYLQSRYYDPIMHRFINGDEYENLGYTSRLLPYNLYTYCDNDPVNYTDKEGKAIWSIIAKIAIGVLSQYAGDIIGNIILGEKGWRIFKPTSSIGTYISAAISSLFKGGRILKNIATSFISTVIRAIENAIKGKKEPIWRLLLDFLKNAVLGIIGDFISSAISSKIMSLTPKNYSQFANSQYIKNPKIKPDQIRIKMQKAVRTGVRSANAFGFLVDSMVAAA